MALWRGIAACWVLTGRSEIAIVPTGHLAVCGGADGRDVVVHGMLRRTAEKSVRYAGELVASEPLNAVRRHLPYTVYIYRLHTDFGFTDTVLQWFSSYLTDRTHYVSLSNHCSTFAPVHSGVPQGSVLGTILFTMYTKPFSAIIDSHSIIHHSFADDLQLQMSAPPDRISELLHSMQSCISDVKAWATANMLKLNDSKTELMLVTSKRSKHLHNLPTSISIG